MNQRETPPEYVAARAVLLDALLALNAHLDAIVLVGAQAVYLHTGDCDLGVAPTTTDADIALSPDRLAETPALEDALQKAGFVRGNQPGTWHGAGTIAIDLMVPESLCPPGGRRGVRLLGHDKHATRRTLGLEPAVVDNARHRLSALDPSDTRAMDLRVAGPAALIIAKVIKIEERREEPLRLKPKDGLDVLRLLRSVDMPVVAERLRLLSQDPMSGVVTSQAIDALRRDGSSASGLIARLAATAVGEDWDTVVQSVASLAAELLELVDSQS
jgi:hypothetical protein